MRLANLISKDLIYFKSDITDYQDIYRLMAKGIAHEFKKNENEIYQAFLERDKLGHTVLPGGFVIPHGRIENLNDVIVAIVRTEKPISVSNGEADMFFGILTGNIASNLYLKVLAGLARIAATKLDELKAQKTPSEIINFIEKQDIKIGEVVRVKDIMPKTVVYAHTDELICTIVDRMKQYDFTFLPVVDDQMKYLGTIDINDVMRLAYPAHLIMMNDLAFVTNLRPYEDFVNAEKNAYVREFYQKNNDKIIHDDMSIIELGFLLTKNHWHHVVVVNNEKKVVGVVSTRTLLNNIIRA